MANILVFSPHPDDVELVIGGLIKKLSSKFNVSIVYMTQGEYSNSICSSERRNECVEACRVLSVGTHEFLDFHDLDISRFSSEQVSTVVKTIRNFRPSIILAPYFSDNNPDHIEAYWLLKRSRYLSGTKFDTSLGAPFYCKNMYYYSQNYIHDQRAIFFDVSQYHTFKLAAINSYKSQFGEAAESTHVKNILLNSILKKDSYYGSVFGIEYAEAIVCEDAIMVSTPFDVITAP